MKAARTNLFVAVALVIAAIFALDRVLPPNVSASVLYVVPILFALRLRSERALTSVTAVCIAASLIDSFLAVAAGSERFLLTNELLALLAQVTTWSLALTQMRMAERERGIYERAEAEHRRLALIHSIATATGGTLDLDGLLRGVADHMARLFKAEAVAIWLADETGLELSPAFYNSEAFAAVKALYQNVRWESSPLAVAESIRRRKLLVITEGRQTSPESAEIMRLLGAKTAVLVPLFARERLVGAMSFSLGDARPFTEDDAQLVETIGKQVAIAIENARLFSDTNRQRERLALVNEIGQVFASTLDLEDIYLTIRARLSEIIDCDTMLVSLYDRQSQTIRCAFAYSEGAVYSPDQFEPIALGAGPQSECIRTACPVIVDNITRRHLSKFRYIGNDDKQPVSVFYVPMIAEEQVIGVIQAQSVREGAYGEEDIPLLSIIANQAASAIQNARLYRDAIEGRLAMERANSIKDEFLATLSHELRTPLTPIVGWTRILSRLSPEDHETRAHALSVIERNARFQAQLINDLLDMSRIESGKLSVQVQPSDLNLAVLASTDSLRREAEGRGVRLEMGVAEQVTVVSADPARLEQIISNLLMNAIKFTDEGGCVTVATFSENGSGVVTVTDTGIGIELDFLPHLFERFRQADSSTRRRHGGLGLGLSIVKSLVEMQSGQITVHSDGPGRGARFTVRLPLAEIGAASPAIEPVDDLHSATAQAVSIAGLRLLVVEDDLDTLEMMRVLCGTRDIEVIEASTAEQGLEMAKRFNPDLIISDISLPVMDGYELARHIRSDSQLRQIPMIAMTGLVSEEDRGRALEAGFDLHLSKPVTSGDLFRAIQSLKPVTSEP
jgi:signal transduction histidine kinase/ActR/RegA family two-component response regulator